MRHLKYVIALVLTFAATVASATVTSGYYYVKSYNSKYLTENITEHTLVCSDLAASTNYAQVWYLTVSGKSVTFKNVLTDRYMQKTTGNSWSEQYLTGTSSNSFTLAEEDDDVLTFTDKWSGGPHCDASLNVVLWSTSEAKSKWTIEAVTVDASALAAQKASFTEASTSQLTTFFTSTACTALKSTYASYTDAALRSAMSALPTTVQDMAIKLKNNSWTTYSGWDKTEKTFRIADYKAYSSHTRWTSILGLSYNFGRLTNPTGISVTAADVIQVYVGTIPSGQTVKLEVAGDNQAIGTTYTLHEGMNTLLMSSSGNCFVQYEVDNTNNGAEPYTPLSNYADVTVHIEGGTVNGYFDLTEGDDNDDWAQLQTHLLQGSNSVELKTSNLLFHMKTALVTSACPSKMIELLGEWDKILDMEQSLMGWEDYDGYWNNLLSATDVTSNYMYATNYGTYYESSTIASVMNYDDLFAGGALWGPAHENGHIHQKYINMVGQTEVSNNVFSNVAVYNNGHLTSRAAFISTTFANMIDGVFWNDRGIWERTHLYFQLYQYFHILGKKSDFYPELFKALRSDPMVHTANTFISATDDYLKFYKKCCEVSGYDLTDFFQAYGFFVIPTLSSYTLNNVTKEAYKVEDYSDYYLTVTQTEIDAAKAEVAAMNLPKCNIIFIEDRITAPDATYEGAAAGTKKTAFSSEYPIGQAGETGQYTDFDAECSAYSYNVSGRGKVQMVGTGAVGFIVYDSQGNIIGFYNTNTFNLPAGVTDYTIKAAAGDGSVVDATLDESIEVAADFPKTLMWYSFRSLRGSRYVLSNGSGEGVVGTTETTLTNAMQWQFVPRDGETETFDIINRNDGSYLSPLSDWNTQVSTSETQPSAGWRVAPASTEGLYIIYSGSVQLNQTTFSGTNGNMIYNWGGGSNTSDEGCQFGIAEVEASGEIPTPTVDVKDVTLIADAGTDVVAVGSQITDESSLVSGKPYLVQYYGNQQPVAYVTEVSGAINVKNYTDATKAAVYYFIDGSNDTWNLQNYCSGNFWNSISGKGSTSSQVLQPVDESSAGSWTLDFTTTSGQTYFSVGDFNLARSGTVLHGWDSKSGYGFKIYEVEASTAALPELEGYDIEVGETAASTVQTGQWYVMFDRGTTPGNHGYLYENSSSHTLYNTATAPSGYAPENAKYLVRIIGEDGNYYLQTGLGNFFGEITESTTVPTTALKEQLITIKKIGGIDGHYYLASSAGVILDANDLSFGDATVVGWGTTVPTATGGNNDWAFYPVTLTISETSLLASGVEVVQGHQVTGQGNAMQALLRIKATPFSDFRPTQFSISLSGADQVDNVKVYSTTSDQLRFAGVTPTLLGTVAMPSDGTVNIDVTASSINANATVYYWITADVKSAATEWETIDASLASISYTNTYKQTNNLEATELDLSDIGDPDGEMRIYKSQAALWTSSKSNAKYYRIPALLKTDENALLAFTDDRYTSHGDLGNHKIDVLVKKSTDGGITWGNAVTVAAGDGSTAAGYGYGDAAVAQAANGDIVCLMAAGKTSFPSGMLHIGFTKSTDGGATWSTVSDLYTNGNLTNPHSSDFTSTFVSSGHGITQTIANAGRIAFPALGKTSSGTNEYVIYSDDNGTTWTYTNNYGYSGADESKLLELNDGKLLMSIRTGSFNSTGTARGYNRTTDTDVENWGTQGTWSDLTANGCNSDLIYYSRSIEGKRDVMLHSVVKSYSNGHRKDLRLYMSFDQGATWEEAFQLQPGWAAYSSMQVLDNGDLAILFEDGSIGNEDESDCYDINYVTISKELIQSKINELLNIGDVNLDGKVTIADVTALVNIILGKGSGGYGVTDINGDGAVTIADVTTLVNIILGK